MTKWELFQALAAEHPMPSRLTDASGRQYVGILRSIEREDGSGRSFNVRIATQSGNTTLHIRTTD
jgi:hypothetical protein